jgi:lipoprotein-releasing system ATP-binding protein
MNNLLECQNIDYQYQNGGQNTKVLDTLNFAVKAGESIAILGQSGCGKSTLLSLLGGLIQPSNGKILIDKNDLTNLNEKQITKIRAQNLGFVFQFHHLLKDFSALENVALPLQIQGVSQKKSRESSTNLLKKIGLSHRLHHLPHALSGGERQRVAIARALITQPKCLLADEPTGNLDASNAKDALDLMIELNAQNQSALVLVTHDEKIAQRMQTVLVLKNGKFE